MKMMGCSKKSREKKIVRGLCALAAAAVLAGLSACGGVSEADEAEKIRTGPVRVATTTTMVTDMVRDVGGEWVEVSGLMRPGVDPHLYKPSASDVTTLTGAEVIFYSGLMLEGRMSDLFAKMGRRGKQVYAVTETIAEERLLEPAEFQGHWDPHVWGDPLLWAETVDVVVKGLSDARPEKAEVFAERGEAVKQEYRDLHSWAVERVREIPENGRIVVTSHDAFNYFGQAFGLQVIGVQGISTVSEAGLADIAETADFIRENSLKAIFVESSVSPAAIQRISKDSGARIGGELFSDAMGMEGDIHTHGDDSYDVGTYPGMIKHNINTVVEALK
ncbi:MAG: zinc ABC transporter substrate-binding protein [Opitutales bacterium]